MPWRDHIAALAQAVIDLSSQPMEVLVASSLSAITTTQKAVAALIGSAIVGGTVTLSVIGILGGVLRAPDDIAEVRALAESNRAQVRAVGSDVDAIVRRLDTLVCELREERLGTRPPECERGILW